MKYLLVVILLFLMVSCTTTKYIEREVPVEVEVVKTEYINKYYKDSVFIHDSIDRYISGDTVHIYEYKYIYKYLNHTDTLIRNDSIEIPVEIKTTEIKEVNKIKLYQKILMYLGLALMAIGIYRIYKFIKSKII